MTNSSCLGSASVAAGTAATTSLVAASASTASPSSDVLMQSEQGTAQAGEYNASGCVQSKSEANLNFARRFEHLS